MKKIISLLMLLGVAANVFSQQVNPGKKQISSKEYLVKSGDQFVLGSILLAGGTGLILVGSNVEKNATGFDFSGTFMKAFGIVAIGGSIPLFISAIHNHKKGKEISAAIKLENSLSLQQLKISCYSFPVLSVKINL